MSKYFFLNQTKIFNVSQTVLSLLTHELESCCLPSKWQGHYMYIYIYTVNFSSYFELMESCSAKRTRMGDLHLC